MSKILFVALLLLALPAPFASAADAPACQPAETATAHFRFVRITPLDQTKSGWHNQSEIVCEMDKALPVGPGCPIVTSGDKSCDFTIDGKKVSAWPGFRMRTLKFDADKSYNLLGADDQTVVNFDISLSEGAHNQGNTELSFPGATTPAHFQATTYFFPSNLSKDGKEKKEGLNAYIEFTRRSSGGH